MATSVELFQQGERGNRRGRPSITREMRELARSKAPEAFERLMELVKDDDPRVALAAANAVLDRAYGKPPAGERKAVVDLAPVTSANGIVSALSQLLAAAVQGDLGISELKDLASVMEIQRKVIETHDLDQRVKALEGRAT